MIQKLEKKQELNEYYKQTLIWVSSDQNLLQLINIIKDQILMNFHLQNKKKLVFYQAYPLYKFKLLLI